MITILDCRMGNLHSMESALQHTGCTRCVTDEEEDLQRADQLILPGVGAFADCMKHLRERDLITTLKEEVQGKKKPLLGIRLDVQALFEDNEENGYIKGLSFLKGNIVKVSGAVESRLRIPHIDQNLLEQCQESNVFERLNERPFIYYVHSYYAQNYAQEDLLADNSYGGIRILGFVRRDNVVDAQFHPEKNGKDELQILRQFKEEFV